jgi:hypothetical protein
MRISRFAPVLVGLTALLGVALTPPASAQVTTITEETLKCERNVCLSINRAGFYIHTATVFMPGVPNGATVTFHYFGPSGTPDLWHTKTLNFQNGHQFQVNYRYWDNALVCGEAWYVEHQGRPCITL